MGRTGGKDKMKRMTIGMAHPPGRLAEIVIKGRIEKEAGLR
jgi:hypothetical protein